MTGESFAILSCLRCGLGHTVPSPEDLTRYYGSRYYGRRHGVTSHLFIKRSLRILNGLGKSARSRRLLDVGCGDGSFLRAAQEAGWRVMGTEIHPEPSRALGLDVKEDMDEIDNAKLFDCITLWHSLEHMRDIKATLSKLAKRIDENGRLLIAVPDNSSWQARFFGARWLHLDVPRHLYHFDPASLRYAIQQAGLDIRYWLRTELEHDLIGWTQSALNCLSPARNAFVDFLMGKGKHHATRTLLREVLMGLVLTCASTPLMLSEALCFKTATVVAVAGAKSC